jgi:hypothetical protein
VEIAPAHAACLLAQLTGDLAAAEHSSAMLLDHSTWFALAFWRAWGRSFQGVLGIQRGDVIERPDCRIKDFRAIATR